MVILILQEKKQLSQSLKEAALLTLLLEKGDTSATGLFLVSTCWASVECAAWVTAAGGGRLEAESRCRGRIWVETLSSSGDSEEDLEEFLVSPEEEGLRGVGGSATTLSWLSSSVSWSGVVLTEQ